MGKRGEQLRQDVVSALRDADGPRSAYDILNVLKNSNPKIAPTTVYRTLNTLTERGEVHRLESLNAYVLCKGEGHDHAAIMSICDDCGTIEETVAPDVLKTMTEAIGQTGFAASKHIVEVHGTCADCTADQGTA